MSEKQTDRSCSNCEFFHDNGDPRGLDEGECHRYPPRIIDTLINWRNWYESDVAELVSLASRWPGVSVRDCCGEFARKDATQ